MLRHCTTGHIRDFSFATHSNINVAVTRTRGTRPKFTTLPNCGKDGTLNNNNNNNNSFGIVNWHQEELQKLDGKTRKLLTIHGQRHPKTDVDRLYVPRKQGGRGLMQQEAAHAVEIT